MVEGINPIVRDMCRFLADYSSLVMRETLFAGELKMGTNGVFAVAAPSPEPDKETGMIYQSIDFWARNKDTGAAFAHLSEIYNFFDRRHHFETDHYYIHFSHCEGQIEDMDRDIDDAKLLKLSIRFILMSQQAIS